MADFLHDRRDFDQLLAVVADERGLDPMLVEKDYWIMHCLWGLQAQGFQFELKGGTSLSKGFGVIHRFSEDIDIRIEPPHGMDVKTGRNQDKPAHVESRRAYYDELAALITIPGIGSVERDTQFDDDKMRSGGIRLVYTPCPPALAGVKDGILLELGFDDTTPNRSVTISSWALDAAMVRG
ncbi:nucleotidyl transferase AbiEii/AbiGii toxin family protein, partial [Verminephrobacter sp. Larva24]